MLAVSSCWIFWNIRSERALVPVDGEVGDRDAAGEAVLAVDLGHRGRELGRGHRTGVLVDGHEVGGGHVEVPPTEGVDHRPRRDRLVADGRDDLALVGGAVEVAELLGVPRPRVREGDLAVDVLAALLDAEVGVGVDHVLLGTDLDAADGVDQAHEPAEADLDVAVDLDAGVLLDGPDQQLRAAVGVGRVDLGRAVAGDLDQRVAGDRHQQVRARAGVQQHDRVGALAGGAAGAELLALLGREVGAGVAADQQVRRPGLVAGPVAAGHRLDLADLVPGDQRDHDQEHQPQQQEQEHVAEPERGTGRAAAVPEAGPAAAASVGSTARRVWRSWSDFSWARRWRPLTAAFDCDGGWIGMTWVSWGGLGGGLGGGLNRCLGLGRRAAAGGGWGGSWPKRWLRSWAASFAWVSSGRRCLGTGGSRRRGRGACRCRRPRAAPPAPYSHSNSGVPSSGAPSPGGRPGRGSRHGGEPTA